MKIWLEDNKTDPAHQTHIKSYGDLSNSVIIVKHKNLEFAVACQIEDMDWMNTVEYLLEFKEDGYRNE